MGPKRKVPEPPANEAMERAIANFIGQCRQLRDATGDDVAEQLNEKGARYKEAVRLGHGHQWNLTENQINVPRKSVKKKVAKPKMENEDLIRELQQQVEKLKKEVEDEK